MHSSIRMTSWHYRVGLLAQLTFTNAWTHVLPQVDIQDHNAGMDVLFYLSGYDQGGRFHQRHEAILGSRCPLKIGQYVARFDDKHFLLSQFPQNFINTEAGASSLALPVIVRVYVSCVSQLSITSFSARSRIHFCFLWLTRVLYLGLPLGSHLSICGSASQCSEIGLSSPGRIWDCGAGLIEVGRSCAYPCILIIEVHHPVNRC
ncbi:hypothetical protein EV702DRAFT_686474 [Suillus placidus]|uniref:Uncharacterized protein n=1 Tax=Suillus placidus TaxID=48579 RepID=A0A9P7D5E8_9AGAM|nr:hypothetical protein EV702DRAFT_686474 [Suillus placidus]